MTVGLRSMFVRCRSRCSRAFLLSCAAGLVLLYSLKTVRRNQDWQSEEMLYRSGIAVNPAKGEFVEFEYWNIRYDSKSKVNTSAISLV